MKLLIIASLLFAVPTAGSDRPVMPDALVNTIWMSETLFGPVLRGELTVSRGKDHGRAHIADVQADFRWTGNEVRFAFSKNTGKFRGALRDKGGEIRGFWIQPRAGTVGSRQSFASPLVLKQERPGTWRGNVQPLDVRFTLFLKFYRDENGTLVAAFRNHDFNSTGGASTFQVSTEGDDVIFTAGPYESQPVIRYRATMDASRVHLRVYWPDAGRTLDLVRRTAEQAPAFFPRPPNTTYSYIRPEETGDGWSTARAKDVGIDENAIRSLMQRLIQTDPAARRYSLIHSILIAYRGKLVIEEYFFGFKRDLPHDSRSAAKTFASVLLGASIRRGTKTDPESRIYDLLGAMRPFANPDPRKSQITLAHLMTHTSGLACNDNDDNSPGNEDRMQRQDEQPNWWKYTLDLPIEHDPGTRYAYCSASMNLVGGALTIANNMWLPELFETTIARPLDFGLYHWNLMPNDEGYLGGGVFLRPRDLLKIGQVYLNGGIWNGKRIVDASWVQQSTAGRVKINPQTTGLDPTEFSNYYVEAEDAYAWHLGSVHSGNRSYSAYMASGNGGQLLAIIPEIQMVAVFTGANYGQGGIWLRWPNEIIGAGIIPAMQNKSQ